VQDLLEETPLPVTMAFYATFLDHDESAALPVLARVPVTVVAATTTGSPPSRPRTAARRGRSARRPSWSSSRVPGTRQLTRAAVVGPGLHGLLDRVADHGAPDGREDQDRVGRARARHT
jgi:hypothetical protein